MVALIKKELSQYFNNLTAYLAVVLFLLANGLLLFVLPQTSLWGDGYASLAGFFADAPWLLLFLIPAMTMKSFAEEQSSGTMEQLITRPLTAWNIILGKYLASLVFEAFALLPTLVYYACLRHLASHPGDLDTGALAGSYMGLFLLGAVFASIGIWASSLTSSSVLAFLLTAFLGAALYAGCSAISTMTSLPGGWDYYIQLMGMQYHYSSISQGLVDSRDIVYFISLALLFLGLAHISLERRTWE